MVRQKRKKLGLTQEHVAARLDSYIAAGARHLVCRIAAPSLASQREQLERIAGILPVLRGLTPPAEGVRTVRTYPVDAVDATDLGRS